MKLRKRALLIIAFALVVSFGCMCTYAISTRANNSEGSIERSIDGINLIKEEATGIDTVDGKFTYINMDN